MNEPTQSTRSDGELVHLFKALLRHECRTAATALLVDAFDRYEELRGQVEFIEQQVGGTPPRDLEAALLLAGTDLMELLGDTDGHYQRVPTMRRLLAQNRDSFIVELNVYVQCCTVVPAWTPGRWSGARRRERRCLI
jgi:hypothetical protein